MATNALLYFVKYPEPGKVKTRLAKVVGFEKAAEVYRNLVEMNLREILSLPKDFIDLIIVFDPAEKESEIKSWLPSSVILSEAKNLCSEILRPDGLRMTYHATQSICYWSQEGADLGVRLQNTFQSAFEKGFKKVMALGSDTLGLKPGLILKGFDALEFYDVAIGPAYDGGYYLIGTNREQPSIFKNIPWSSPDVFESTLNKLIEGNLSYYLLEKLDDLDEAKNLRGGKKHEIFT